MKGYHKHGGLKKGTAVVLAACFLLGSSVTALAAGDGVTDGYMELANTTRVMNTYDEALTGGVDVIDDVADDEMLELLVKNWDIDPEKVVFMDDDVEEYTDLREIWWIIEPGWTYVSTGFNQKVDDIVTIVVDGTPDDLEYQMGIKDPKAIMWYVEGSGRVSQDFVIQKKGRHYFFVYNPSETEDLEVTAYIIR